MRKLLMIILLLINIPAGLFISSLKSKSNFNYIQLMGVGFLFIIPSIPPHYGDSLRYFRLYELFTGNFSYDIRFLNNIYGEKFHSILYIIIMAFKRYNINYIIIPAILFFVSYYLRYSLFRKIDVKKYKVFYFFALPSFYSIIFGLRFPFGFTLLILGMYEYYYFNKKSGVIKMILGCLFHEMLIIFPVLFVLVKKMDFLVKKKKKLMISSFFMYPLIYTFANRFRGSFYIFEKLCIYAERDGFIKGAIFNKYSLVFFVFTKITFIVFCYYIYRIPRVRKNRYLLNINYFFMYLSIIFIYKSNLGGRLSTMFMYSSLIYIYIYRRKIFKKKFEEWVLLVTIYIPAILRTAIYIYGFFLNSFNHFNRVPSYIYQPSIIQSFNYDYTNKKIQANYSISRRYLIGEENGKEYKIKKY